MPPDCFSDEIAIDFPSVGNAVERMRAAFLDEGRGDDVVRADVLLSSREAWKGRVVPIEVPIRGTCLHCGGRGETWTERCEACCGTGESLFRHALRIPVPPGVVEGACFRFRVSPPHARPLRVEVRVAIRSSAA